MSQKPIKNPINLGRFAVSEEDFYVLALNLTPRKKLPLIVDFDKLPKKQFNLITSRVTAELERMLQFRGARPSKQKCEHINIQVKVKNGT